MGSLQDALGKLAKGDVITAEWLNKLAALATGANVPASGIQDATGSYSQGPILGPYWRHAITAANPNEGPYPAAADQPNTYWFNFVTINLSTTPLGSGYQSPQFVATTEPMGMVYWHGNRYVPEGTLIRVWKVAPGRPPTVPNSRSDMWVAFDQQQVAGYVTFTLKDPLLKNQATVTAIFDEFWDGQQPWNVDDNPAKEFNLVNTALMFPWETGVTSYPAGTKGSAMLDPESTKAAPLSYRIIFMHYPDSDSSIGQPPVTVDVVVCEPWNRCGQYIMFPQKRITLPYGTSIVDLPPTAVPIYICQSSGGEPPISSGGDGAPPDSGFGPSDFSWSLYNDSLTVSGTLSPDATGVYTFSHWFNGRPVWRKVLGDTNWVIYWSDMAGSWMLYGGDPGNSWHKSWPPIEDVLGQWNPGANAEGVATVSVTP